MFTTSTVSSLMKFFLTAFLFFCSVAGIQAQVSQAYYKYFVEEVKKQTDDPQKGFYAVLVSASQICFNLDSPEYQKEIQRLSATGVNAEKAVDKIPRETFQKFLNDDYLRVFCPDLSNYKDVMDVYGKRICDCLTPELIKVPINERYLIMQKVVAECNSTLMMDTDLVGLFRAKALESKATLAQLSKSAGIYMYFTCPLLKEDLSEIPTLVNNNALGHYQVNKKWEIINNLSEVIKGEQSLEDIKDIFYDKKALAEFKSQLNNLSDKLRILRNNNSSAIVDWAAGSCKQTFAIIGPGEDIRILFQFLYHLQVEGTSIKVTGSELTRTKDLEKNADLISKFKARFNDPEVIDPGSPLPPPSSGRK